ncbi:hypothetical protein HS088_TW09G00350 [Tripterygium wilfordii]|uniref:Uncharacterized protein n=1 Tax=Tripterygium wilfordii TaxID=458696 RepID=A0A7J7D8C2_TRIWF|nr:hypothetical protein HS088_TW09G00350 [Tripterygium wilfordii]
MVEIKLEADDNEQKLPCLQVLNRACSPLWTLMLPIEFHTQLQGQGWQCVLYVIDGSATISPELAANYRLQFIDFMHALMSILVFAALALFDQNVVSCFYPTPSVEAQEIITAVPVGIGVICSMLFIAFPTKLHGIGFPIINQLSENSVDFICTSLIFLNILPFVLPANRFLQLNNSIHYF